MQFSIVITYDRKNIRLLLEKISETKTQENIKWLPVTSHLFCRLMEALQKNKHEKWMTLVIDHTKKTMEYQNKIVTELEMKSIIEEPSKEYQVKLIIMNQNRTDEGIEEVWSFCDPEIVVNFVNG